MEFGMEGMKEETTMEVTRVEPKPLFISIADAAKETGLSRAYLRSLASSGKVRYLVLGNDRHAKWMLNRAELEKALHIESEVVL